MEKLKDQLSQEELNLVTGGTSSSGILSENQPNTRELASDCSGSVCRRRCTNGCASGCSNSCTDAAGKDGYR